MPTDRTAVGLLQIPFDGNSSHLRGSAGGPRAIRRALFSTASNLTSENGTDLGEPGRLVELKPVAIAEGISFREPIESAVAELLQRGLHPLCLGGDHSVSWPIVRAVARLHRPLSLLLIDAHPDLYDELDGNRDSHACPFARILEEGLVARMVQVGIRTMNEQQRAQAERFGVEVIEMRDWSPEKILTFDTPLYLSIDLDGLDPAFAPGVSHPEPGGFSTRELLAAVRSIRAEIVAADVVELNPSRDVNGVTAVVGAKLVKELAARLLNGAD